jgi:hypothetical protein
MLSSEGTTLLTLLPVYWGQQTVLITALFLRSLVTATPISASLFSFSLLRFCADERVLGEFYQFFHHPIDPTGSIQY